MATHQLSDPRALLCGGERGGPARGLERHGAMPGARAGAQHWRLELPDPPPEVDTEDRQGEAGGEPGGAARVPPAPGAGAVPAGAEDRRRGVRAADAARQGGARPGRRSLRTPGREVRRQRLRRPAAVGAGPGHGGRYDERPQGEAGAVLEGRTLVSTYQGGGRGD
jgi:hypothetical protein